MHDPVRVVRDHLEAAGCRPRGPEHNFMALCPVHDDSDASLHVNEGDDGRALIRCHAGCETTEVVDALGLQLRNLFVPTVPGTPRPKRKRRRRQAEEGDALLRVLARHTPNYRCTPTRGFYLAACKVCDGELWIYCAPDEDGDLEGPVTVSCCNGCFTTNTRRRAA